MTVLGICHEVSSAPTFDGTVYQIKAGHPPAYQAILPFRDVVRLNDK